MKKPPRKILKMPLEERAERALRAAVRKAMKRHMQMGVPMYVWQDGRVLELSAKELELLLKSA